MGNSEGAESMFVRAIAIKIWPRTMIFPLVLSRLLSSLDQRLTIEKLIRDEDDGWMTGRMKDTWRAGMYGFDRIRKIDTMQTASDENWMIFRVNSLND